MRGWQVGSHLQAKERVLTKDQPCSILILNSQLPELWDNTFLLLKPLKSVVFVVGEKPQQ